MKNGFPILLFLMATSSANAQYLADVKVLDSTLAKDGLELKLQVNNAPKDSYFIVDLVKSDQNAFAKLALVFKKLEKGADFKLNLDIPSFSLSPPGSYYRSVNVKFYGGDR